MQDLRENPENIRFRLCHRPSLSAISGEPENILFTKVPMHNYAKRSNQR